NSVVYNPCISQKEYPMEEMQIFLDNWPDDQNVSRIDRSYKCFMTCVLIDLGLMNDNGQLQIEKHLEFGFVDPHWWIKELAPCRTKYEDEHDLCEFAFGIFNCFRERKL
ncbi:hypothetical protein KR009_004951, partial [Drosophila setifemur]